MLCIVYSLVNNLRYARAERNLEVRFYTHFDDFASYQIT